MGVASPDKLLTGKMAMKDYVLNKKPEPAANEMVWAFDLGRASIGEAVRRGNEFLHKASLLILAEFAETKTAARPRPPARVLFAARRCGTGQPREIEFGKCEWPSAKDAF
jgi:hypothetical protein